jgi:hypothetical protein
MHSAVEAGVPTGDAPEYRLERGYQDLAAVVDTAAAAAGNR